MLVEPLRVTAVAVAVATGTPVPSQNTLASAAAAAATAGAEAVTLCPLEVSIALTAVVKAATEVVRSAVVTAVAALGSG